MGECVGVSFNLNKIFLCLWADGELNTAKESRRKGLVQSYIFPSLSALHTLEET